MRVGARIRRLGLNEEYINPIILPKRSKVTKLIIKWCHLKAEHCGRGITFNEIRDRNFWIISAVLRQNQLCFIVLLAENLEEIMGV